MMKKLKRKKGFTLIELIIVIAIIGVLAAIAVPKYGEIQKDAKVKADIASAKVIADATNALIANDGITNIATYSAPSALGDDIKGYIQVEPVVKAVKNEVFKVKIDAATEDVQVTVNGIELYPIPDLTYAKIVPEAPVE